MVIEIVALKYVRTEGRKLTVDFFCVNEGDLYRQQQMSATISGREF